MCLGDWRLGNLLRWNVQTHLAVASITTIIAPRNSGRVGINIAVETAQFATNPPTWFVDVYVKTIDNIQSCVGNLNLGNNPLYRTLLDFGPLVREEWHLDTAGNPMDLHVIEWFLPVEVVAAAGDQFRAGLNDFYGRQPALPDDYIGVGNGISPAKIAADFGRLSEIAGGGTGFNTST